MTDLREKIDNILDVYEIEGIDATDDINQIIVLCMDEAIEAVNRVAKPYLYSDGSPTGMGADLNYSDAIKAIEALKKPSCTICGDHDMWDERFCHACAKEHYS